MGGGTNSAKKSRAIIRRQGNAGDSGVLFPVEGNVTEPSIISPPMVSSYNDRIRPLLDAVDKLRHLNVAKEGIQLPTIVVVGDQSSGKSSVLESLAGISLPRGQGICTRVPLIMRLQHHPSPQPEFYLEFNGKTVSTDEMHVADAISAATEEIAGNGKGISNMQLTLVVKKNGVPDLTMVDLPGITRVPVHGQPENIYEQIAEIIMEYIKPEESIILNVLSATVDFTTCESIRMSQKVDKTGERTLAVVTKCDRLPEGLFEKVTADDVNIGLGYVCVRNRIGDETYEEARIEEAALFETDTYLSKIDKSMVGIPVLAQKLVQIQATIIAKCFPDIVRKIHEKLNACISDINKLPKKLSSPAEALSTFMSLIGAAKESLNKIVLCGEYLEYPNADNMHCAARLVDMFNQYSSDLNNSVEGDPTINFMIDEVRLLDEGKRISLPNFVPRTAFLAIWQPKIQRISYIPVSFVEKVWDYVEEVVIAVLSNYCENFQHLQYSAKRACHSLVEKMKAKSTNWVMELVQMEEKTDYTCSPEYVTELSKLMSAQHSFLNHVEKNQTSNFQIEGLGVFTVKDLARYKHVLGQAYDLKMRITTYWKIVMRRLVDNMALHLQHNLRNLVEHELQSEILNQLLTAKDGKIEKMLGESPAIAGKREKLNASIKLLNHSKDVLADIMDNFNLW